MQQRTQDEAQSQWEGLEADFFSAPDAEDRAATFAFVERAAARTRQARWVRRALAAGGAAALSVVALAWILVPSERAEDPAAAPHAGASAQLLAPLGATGPLTAAPASPSLPIAGPETTGAGAGCETLLSGRMQSRLRAFARRPLRRSRRASGRGRRRALAGRQGSAPVAVAPRLP